MAEHKGTSFVHSCVKVPVDPYSRQPTPMYERPKIPTVSTPMPEVNNKSTKAPATARRQCEQRKAHTRSPLPNPTSNPSSRLDDHSSADPTSARDDFIEFFESIPDYCDVHHLSNEQFRQKLDYLKRKQRMLLKNLRNCLEQDENLEPPVSRIRPTTATATPTPAAPTTTTPTTNTATTAAPTITTCSPADNRKSMSDRRSSSLGDHSELTLKGKRCNFEESRVYSPPPPIYPSGNFSCLAEDQDLLTYRCRYLHEKASKTRHNEAILSGSKDWSSGSEESTVEKGVLESYDKEIGIETKSLPPRSPKKWQPTLPKPFSFTLREDAEKYMAMVEQQAAEEYELSHPSRKNPAKKRRIRPVPLTSKIPLYDKLMAEKEERSRIVREESALSLLSQVRPFKLECDRRALRALTRSSPELSSCGAAAIGKIHCPRFRAKPVPRDLFSTDVYDRMLEDEYFRNLQKRIRSVELMKSASLPPSMARRERCKSAVSLRSKSSSEERTRSGRDSIALSRGTPLPSERSRCSAMTSVLPPHGNNLAAILRAQASREKMEREVQQRLEEKRYEQMLRLRKALIGRKPAWRALRSAARHEHERDLDFRASLRRDEAREQAERHRFQMEMMLDRVTQIPTLFERYSQSFQNSLRLCPKLNTAKIPTHQCSSSGNISSANISSASKKKKKKKKPRHSSSSADSYVSMGSSSRPNSGSLTSSSGTIGTSSHSSGHTHKLLRCTSPKPFVSEKKKSDRGPLKVSINETAELIEDVREDYEETFSMDSASSHVRQEREKRALADDHEVIEKE